VRTEEFARALLDRWSVGEQPCANGIVLAVDYDAGDVAIAAAARAGKYLAAAVRDGVLADFRADVAQRGFDPQDAVLNAVRSIGYCLGHECYRTPAFVEHPARPCAGAFPGCHPADLPRPDRDPIQCGTEGLKASICDPSEQLSMADIRRVDRELGHIRSAAGDYVADPCTGGDRHGFQVGVLVLERISPRFMVAAASHTDRGAQFAKDAAYYWGLGDAGCNNGVLLLVETVGDGPGQRNVAVSTGEGAKDFLNRAKVRGVVQDFVKDMQSTQGDLGESVVRAVRNIGYCLGHSCYSEPAHRPADAPDGEPVAKAGSAQRSGDAGRARARQVDVDAGGAGALVVLGVFGALVGLLVLLSVCAGGSGASKKADAADEVNARVERSQVSSASSGLRRRATAYQDAQLRLAQETGAGAGARAGADGRYRAGEGGSLGGFGAARARENLAEAARVRRDGEAIGKRRGENVSDEKDMGGGNADGGDAVAVAW